MLQKKTRMRQRGIEPRSTAWKATMLTITPLTLACQDNVEWQVRFGGK